MAKYRKPGGSRSTPPGVHTDGTSRAISDALNSAYKSVINEPVPDRLKAVIERIRAAEKAKRKSSDS